MSTRLYKIGLMQVVLLLALLPLSKTASGQQMIAGYDFSEPDQVLKLSKSLKEISGLASGPDGQLYAVQDEKGIIFQLNPDDGSILAEQKFYGDGDYEGIERVGNTMYILRSSGHLFEVDLGQRGGIKATRKSRLNLPSRCDAEALGSDPAAGTLWVGCKNADGVKGKKTRSLFRLTVENDKWEAKLKVSINQKMLTEANSDSKWSINKFMPSGLTIREYVIFVLSAVNDLLLIIQPTRVDMVELSEMGLPQAEGIALGADGTLYIASEGVGSRARLLAFRHHPTN